MPNETEAKKPRGTCPICYGDYGLKGARMGRHGYKQPGRGTGYAPRRGICPAAGRFPPLEASPEGALYVIDGASGAIETAREFLRRAAAGEIVELMIPVRGDAMERERWQQVDPETVKTCRPLQGAPTWSAQLGFAVTRARDELAQQEGTKTKAETMLRAFWPEALASRGDA